LTTESFSAEWMRLIETSAAGKKEVEAGQPIRLIYGANELGEAVFFSITDIKPGLPDLSSAVRVERGVRRIDGRWTLALTLRDKRFLDVFLKLCEDLAYRTVPASSEAHALSLLLAGVTDWKQLLHSPASQRLSINEIRGLAAELWFGFAKLAQSRKVAQVLDAWTGPLGRPQDFNFPLGEVYEIKSTYADASSVRISSAEQLDAFDRDLRLVTVVLEPVQEHSAPAFSLPTLISEIRGQIQSSPADSAKLDVRFEALHFDAADDYYSDFWFVVRSHQQYQVRSDFPAIRASTTQAGLSRIEYTISLAAISQYKVS
jgi:hypothetical protein